MKKYFMLLIVLMLPTTIAHAHGNISKLPDSVQILQYKMALFMKKDDIDLQNKLAMAYFRNDQLKEAKEHLEAVLKNDKRNFDSLDGLGLVFFKMGENKKALSYLKKALVVNPDDMMIHVHLALNYEKLDLKELSKKEILIARSLAKGAEEQKAIEEEIAILSLIGS